MILIFFLQYFNYFGEVIFSPLIYFNMKYFSERKIIKTKILVSKFDKIKFENWGNPQLSPRVLELLRISRIAKENAIKYDMQE